MTQGSIQIPLTVTLAGEIEIDSEVTVYYTQYEDGEVDIDDIELETANIKDLFSSEQLLSLEDLIKEGCGE